MTKYRNKILVTAKKYVPGMEDGFLCKHYGSIICEQHKQQASENDYPRCKACKREGMFIRKAFIGWGNKQFVKEGDMLVTIGKGIVKVMSEEEFNRCYEEVIE